MYSFDKGEKVLIPVICLIGISAVGYGMVKEDNPVFISGLLFVIAGYLLIRRKLKAYLRNRSQ